MIPIRKFNDNQIILNSDRLVFNAKQDNIILSSKKDVAIVAAGSVHINIGPSAGKSDNNFLIINSPKIQFGLGSVQPVAKGNDLADLLNKILNALNDLASSLTSATGIGVGTVTEPTVNAAGIKLQGAIQNITAKVDNIKSKITFTA